jgi:hypothetical protein
MKHFLLFIFSSMISLQARAWLPCEYSFVKANGSWSARFATVGLGCVVQMTPKEKPEMRYREYWFDERGRFLVYSSIGEGDPLLFSGTRSYFLFPRKQQLSVALNNEGRPTVTLASGDQIVFSEDNGRIVSFPGEFTESEDVTFENLGGVEIKAFKGIVLDSGWKVGVEAYKSPEAHSFFVDESGRKCLVRNNEVFFYENMYYGEPNLTYPDDASLATFLKARCPELDVSRLLTPSTFWPKM